MAALTLIAQQTPAVSVPRQFRVKQLSLPMTLIATNLAGSEEVDVFVSVDDGLNFEAVFQDGAAVALTATANTMAVNSPGLFAVTKDATAGLAGVFLAGGQEI